MSRTFCNHLEQSQFGPIYADCAQMQQPKRPVVVNAFGNWLQELRGRLSRQQVINRLKKYDVTLDPSTLHQYEHGRVAAPDPVVLLGLAEIYRTDIAEIISVLAANRGNPKLSENEVTQVLQAVRASRHVQAAAATRLDELQGTLRTVAGEIFRLAEAAAGVGADSESLTTRNVPTSRRTISRQRDR